MAELDEQLVAEETISPPVKWWVGAVTVQILVLAAILGWHYRPVIDRLINIWSNNGDWSHGFIIPFFSIYYLCMRRHAMPRGLVDKGLSSRLAGAALLTAGFMIYVFFTLHPAEYLKALSLVVTIMGIVLMLCGWPLARWSWFAVAFLCFAVPLPERLYQQMTMPLREIAASMSGMALSMIPDMLAEARGTVVEYIYQGRAGVLDIERACSGMRLMVTMTALGVAMAFVNERPLWQRLVMILACVPIAIFCNIIRVTTTGFLFVFEKPELATGFWHTMLGLGMLFIAFSLYGGISYVLGHLVVEDSSGRAESNDLAAGGMTP